MKEAFWGVLIVMLGLFGIVVINLFQKVTIENDKVYYVIKEATEASMYDAVDLSTYRLTGRLRMVEDKFVENLTRRFAQNVSLGNYTITVQDINETPPYVSVVVKSSISSIKGDMFNITNSVNGILETKYTLEELLEFLGITEDEWNSIQKGDKNVCDMSNFGESECIPGDLKFGGFEDATVRASNCEPDYDPEETRNVKATAIYYECECGKWKEYKEEISTTGQEKSSEEIAYTWTFTKEGQLSNINETMTRKTKLDKCTTGVEVMVPKYLVDLSIPLPTDLVEPSKKDNSQYAVCPEEGIKIPSEQEIMLHGGYIPEDATNRMLDWFKTGNGLKSIYYYQNGYISKKSYSKAKIIANKIEIGNPEESSNVTAKTSLNQTGTCKVNVWDGRITDLECKDMSILTTDNSKSMEFKYKPNNANKLGFEWSIDNDIATINSETGKITPRKAGNATVTITYRYDIITNNGEKKNTATCSLKISSPPPPPPAPPVPVCPFLSGGGCGDIDCSTYWCT